MKAIPTRRALAISAAATIIPAALAVTALAAAPNLVKNGDFSQGTNDWTAGPQGNGIFSVQKGSAVLDAKHQGPMTVFGITTQCFPVQPNATYEGSGSILPALARGSWTRMNVYIFEDANCQQNWNIQDLSFYEQAGMGWKQESGQITTGPTAKSAFVILAASATNWGGIAPDLRARFDNVSFRIVPPSTLPK